MKRIVAAITALIITLLTFSSCSGDGPVVLFFGVSSPAGSFDPQIVSDVTASIVVRNCFEGLLRKDRDGNVINGVAQSYDVSPDGTVYTFNLRHDAKWHLTSNAKDQAGEKLPEDFSLSVTSYDFAFALKRAVAPETGAHMAYMLYNITGAPEIMEGKADKNTLGVETPDPYTLIINLSRPQSNFPEVLCEPVAMPCNETFFNSCSGRYGTLIKFSLSNGPFYLSRFDEKSYRINRADDYAGISPAVPDAVWLYTDNMKHTVEQLQKDEYSGAVLSNYAYDTLKVSDSMTVIETPNVIRGFIMNLRDEVLGNEDIRKAISAATDVSTVAANGGRTPVMGLVPSSAASDKVSTHPEPYSEEKAGIYLKNGLMTLEKNRAEINLLCESEYEDTMRRLLQEWQRILGISISFTVKTATAEEIASAVKTGRYQIAFSPVAAGTDSAYEYFGSFTSASPYNITGYDAAGLEEMIAKLYAGNDDDFIAQYAAIENRLSSASVILPVWEENTYFVCTKGVENVMFFSGEDKLYFHNANKLK